MRRTVVILDCCFSGQALDGEMGGEGILSPGQLPDVVARETRLPGAMTASAATRKALAPVGATYTAFTGELIAVLRDRHRWTRTPRHERPLHRADPPNETALASSAMDTAIGHHRAALTIAEEIGNDLGQLNAVNGLARAAMSQADLGTAAER
ncbi:MULTISPECIES: hypothetical protein [unclassified Streptomyces]|uniref:hypothetical protein n=1 Tax=unclassified Streptomyces TaxID=2593676 RepID=UPI00225B889C|nr:MULTISPECIES: hypothetical protein [unclassified Streptomyces]MCX4406305.1 hypothetical protein [Streptomyces sp. NBC_01764]MCX5189171.1 hypothetical protein [Streptomyces sp. NBC_00268]